MFTITSGKGFRMQFDNGYQVSVQWGYGNYCEKRFSGIVGDERKEDFYLSSTAEVAVMDKNGEFCRIEDIGCVYDDFQGNMTTKEVLAILNFVEAL
jgi:hypothetical protein